MRVPVSINILGEKITVSYIDHDDEAHGYYDNDRNLIQIVKGDPAMMHRTLIHELGHCLFRKTGWAETLGPRREEAMCQLLEHLAAVVAFKQGSCQWTDLAEN